MKTGSVILTIVVILILIGVGFLIYKSTKQTKIKNAAISSGVSPAAATAIATSTNPAAAARSIGISPVLAAAIANGISIQPTA